MKTRTVLGAITACLALTLASVEAGGRTPPNGEQPNGNGNGMNGTEQTLSGTIESINEEDSTLVIQENGMMDTIMIDVTAVPDARVGDEVVLIGRQGAEEILADEIAANGGTINYEIVCKISPRVTRVFIQT